MESEDDSCDGERAEQDEPPSAVEVWALGDGQGDDGNRIGTAEVVCGHAEDVAAGRDVCVVGNMSRAGVIPVVVKSLELVLEAHSLLRPHHNGGVTDLEAGGTPCQRDLVTRGNLAAIPPDRAKH